MRRYVNLLRHDAGGSLAFVATVVAAYASLFLAGSTGLSLGTVLAVLALGAVLLLVGTAGYSRVASRGPGPVWLYLLIQVALASTALYLCRAQGFTSLLYFPLVSHAWYSLPRRQAYLACALITIAFMGVIALLAGWPAALGNSFVILAGVIFVAVFTDQTLREQKARGEVERLARELADANLQLRAHAEQVEELATAKERNRLAREIHDSLGHYLTVINVQLEAARLLLDRGDQAPPDETGRALAALRKAQSLAQEGLADVRRSVAALRAGPNGSRPLPEAVTALADEARAAGIVTHFNLHGQARPLTAQAELTLYRAAQEALTNVRKHARASRAEVTLDYAAPERVRLTIADNGVGSAAASGGFGLLGLRERVQLLGGTVATHTAPGEGFRLEVEAPG
jgi:signal transduction histidine kinase